MSSFCMPIVLWRLNMPSHGIGGGHVSVGRVDKSDGAAGLGLGVVAQAEHAVAAAGASPSCNGERGRSKDAFFDL